MAKLSRKDKTKLGKSIKDRLSKGDETLYSEYKVPEELIAEEDIKKLERRVKANDKTIAKTKLKKKKK